MSERKEFKTETKRLLDLMINSIYTNKEIFLRELISNASDAIDKYHYLSLQDTNIEKRSDYKIKIEVNNEERTITISDNGIGMTYDEVVNNLGTIASSGSLEFIKKLEEKENKEEEIDIIGQFGVGFYSAFMVANKVEVTTKSPYSDKGYIFISTGEDSYEIDEVTKEEKYKDYPFERIDYIAVDNNMKLYTIYGAIEYRAEANSIYDLDSTKYNSLTISSFKL